MQILTKFAHGDVDDNGDVGDVSSGVKSDANRLVKYRWASKNTEINKSGSSICLKLCKAMPFQDQH